MTQPDPEILSPRSGIYYVDSTQSMDKLRIPLQASLPVSGLLYWFDGNTFIGAADAKSLLFWSPRPGNHLIHLVDEKGRSASRKINVIMSQ
jgi:penicillin-binding protein 1C